MALRDKNAVFCAIVLFIENFTGCSGNGAGPKRLQRKLCAIHIDVAIFDSHRITSDGDHASDREPMPVLSIDRQDNVTPSRVGIVVGIFYSDEAVTRKNGWIHVWAGDAERLNQLGTNS